MEYASPNIRFLIPKAVLRELSGRSDKFRSRQFFHILGRHGDKYTLLPNPEGWPQHKGGDEGVDMLVLKTAIDHSISHPDSRVVLATDDSDFTTAKLNLGGNFDIVNGNKLRSFIRSNSETTSSKANPKGLEKSPEGQSYTLWNRLRLWGSFIIAGAFGWGANRLFALASQADPATLRLIPTCLAAAIGGPLLFMLRSRFHLAYGLIEVTVGYIAAAYAIFSPSKSDNTTLTILQLLGGLYIIVRGMDNIEKATDKSAFNARWTRFFKGNKNPLTDPNIHIKHF